MTKPSIEIFKTGSDRVCLPSDWVTIRLDDKVLTMTAGEWSRLITNPQQVSPREEGEPVPA